MVDSMAQVAMDFKAAGLSQDYSLSMMKKVMDTQKLAAEEMIEMLPQRQQQKVPYPPKGQFIDVYA